MEEIIKQDKKPVLEKVWVWYLIVLTAAGVLYVFTCAPAILWQDSGLFVYRIYHNDIEGNLGLALAHPLYILTGMLVKSISVGQLAFRINLMSAFFGALAVANLFLLLRLWSGKIMPALIGAITLAVSWTFWQHAVIAETYTLFAAQFFGELIMLLLYVRSRRVKYLYFLGFLNGLTIANHMWGVFGFACYVIFIAVLLVRRQIGCKNLIIFALLWVIGALPYEYIIVKNIIASGDIAGTLASAVFGDMWQSKVFNVSVSAKLMLENIIFILLNFPTPNFILLFVGLWCLYKKAPSRGFGNIVLVLVAFHFVFAFRYNVPDRFAFFIPFYCLAAVLMGLGADVVLSRCGRKGLLWGILLFTLLPIAVYFFTPDFARKTYKPLGQRRQRPYRDEYQYFLQPWKTGYRGAERFAREALDMVEQDAIIYAYTTDAHALLYMQEVMGQRSDVKIVSDHDMSKDAPVFTDETVEKLLESGAVYVTSATKSYCPRFILDNYDTVKQGVLYRVVKREQRE